MHGRAGFPGVWSSKGSKTVVGGAGLQFVCQGRAIKRAFEVEDTTSVYSGTLRMADLLALQPNMNIRFHIVVLISRREKVFQELRRPVFLCLD